MPSCSGGMGDHPSRSPLWGPATCHSMLLQPQLEWWGSLAGWQSSQRSGSSTPCCAKASYSRNHKVVANIFPDFPKICLQVCHFKPRMEAGSIRIWGNKENLRPSPTVLSVLGSQMVMVTGKHDYSCILQSSILIKYILSHTVK